MNRKKRAAGLAALAATLSLVSSCSQPAQLPVAPVVTPTSAAPTDQPPPTPASSPSGATSTPSPRNDLKAGRLKRTVASGPLQIGVEYFASVPVAGWSAESSKSVKVKLSIVDRRHSRKRVYLTRATARFTVRADDTELPAPDSVVDTANIQPGYLATSPYSYVQSFAIPPLDGAATSVSIDFKFELVTLVDRKAKDYTKQTVSNTLQIALQV